MGPTRKVRMGKTRISNADLAWLFTEKLKSFRAGAPVSIAIVPNRDGWTAIASRNDHNRCSKYIEQVQVELRELYVLAKD
jgi:hypothetical protein